MNSMTRLRVSGPLLGAALVFLVCLVGYVLTVSPSVTFWDAGEFLAASKALGVPHPPGTPLFTFLSNTWARLFPVGEYAFRVGVMVAACAAMSAALFYLVVLEIMGGREAEGNGGNRSSAHAAALAGALVSAFTFTVWQSANEAEVYMLASLLVSATALSALRWRRRRGTSGGTKYLLLAVYLSALSVGVHLLGLLVGPALIVFVWHQLWRHPHQDRSVRRAEAGHLAVIAGVWLLLVAVGLGSRGLLMVAGLAVLLGLAVAWMRGAAPFALAALAISAVAVTTYVYVYIRAGLAPAINMGDASTWDGLAALIARKQYPLRLPWDNPLFISGPDNPGRTLELVGLQILNYVQYFDWQWSRGLAAAQPYLAWPRLPITMAFLSLGIYGAAVLHRRDRSASLLLLWIFLVTGPGLVAYMNFKPGFSIGYDRFPSYTQHEVRERDYFFLLSFQVWGLWAGVGIAALYGRLRSWLVTHGIRAAIRPAVAALPYGLAFLPILLNYAAADRNRDPEARLPFDFAYDMLQSVEPYAVLVTAGDNDTYPLWYAQEVMGVRRDVTVVVSTLTNLDWCVRQMRDRPVRPFDPAAAPWYADVAPETVPPPPHTMTDEQIASLRSLALPDSFRYRAGVLDYTLEAGTPLYVQDQVLLRVIQESIGKRSIYFASSSFASMSGSRTLEMLRDSIVREGMVFRLYAERPAEQRLLAVGFDGIPVDIERTDTLANEVYRYAGLFEADTSRLGSTERQIVANMGTMFLALGSAQTSVGDREGAVANLERANHLMPEAGLGSFIETLRGSSDAGM
ncbi:MAG: DUF2723 domain-containing protein [Gemmatimonadota bacterium]|nr:MAG: DUF2723 domain-containing protein [Gemmatimonadota bacterium]